MNFLRNAKKSLGQNFLIDKNIINKIIKIGNIDNSKTVLEIGPGYGNLTEKILASNPHKIFAIEKDTNLSSFLKKKFQNSSNLKIINNDILNVLNKNNFGKNVVVFGNLPYNISTQILASLILVEKWPPWFDILILMFQKEVADRIIAKKKSSSYGRLSVLSNWRLDIKKHFDISNSCFFPKPKIESTVLSFKPKKNNKYILKNPKNLENITRILFSNRRKMINKSFLKIFKQNKLIANKLELDLKLRPEDLSNEMFYKIAIKYEELFC